MLGIEKDSLKIERFYVEIFKGKKTRLKVFKEKMIVKIIILKGFYMIRILS